MCLFEKISNAQKDNHLKHTKSNQEYISKENDSTKNTEQWSCTTRGINIIIRFKMLRNLEADTKGRKYNVCAKKQIKIVKNILLGDCLLVRMYQGHRDIIIRMNGVFIK